MWKHPSHKCLVYFPQERDRAVLSFLDRLSWEDEVDIQLREKEAETSNRLLDVRGHSVTEAEVDLSPSPSLSLVSLPFSLWRVLLIHFPCTLA